MSFKQTKLALGVAALLGASLSVALPASAADENKAKAEKKADEKPKWDVLNPPGERETITIDTNTTTWSNLDVSPDGKTIVFDMLGDIYTMPISGGEAKALTNDIAWNTEPRFSPDGKSIAFISDRKGGENIWIMAVDGSDMKQVSKEKHHIVHNPDWSPDGDYIVAKQSQMGTRSIGGGSIWMYHVSGGKGLEVRQRLHGKESPKEHCRAKHVS